MVELWINYWSGNFYVGTFDKREDAEQFYEEHKEVYRDYRGEEYGFPYGTPLYMNKND